MLRYSLIDLDLQEPVVKVDLISWKCKYGFLISLETDKEKAVVEYELKKLHCRLLVGLAYFKPINLFPSGVWREIHVSRLNEFIARLSPILNVDKKVTWEVLSNYLLYGFRGSSVSIEQILLDENRTSNLFHDIYCFYLRERMFLLKTVNYIVTAANDRSHCYYEIMVNWIEKITVEKLYDSFHVQIAMVREAHIPYLTSDKNAQLKQFWIEHNIIEQRELLKLMILLMPKLQPSYANLQQMIHVIYGYQFGEIDHYHAGDINPINKSDIKALGYLEVIHFLQLVLYFRKMVDDSLWDRATDEQIKLLKLEEKRNSAIYFTWLIVRIVFQYAKKEYDANEDFDKAKGMPPWDYFYMVLTHESVKFDPVIFDLACSSIYEVLLLSIDNFGIDAIIEHGIVYKVASTLLEKPEIGAQLLSEPQNGIGLLLQKAGLWFPVQSIPCFDILTPLMKISMEQCEQVFQLLPNVIKFAHVAEYQMLHTIRAQEENEPFYSARPVKPMRSYNDYSIPEGTLCRFVHIDNPENHIILLWHYHLPIWVVMKNFVEVFVDKVGLPTLPSILVQVNEDQVEGERAQVIAFLKFFTAVLHYPYLVTTDIVESAQAALHVITRLCIMGDTSDVELLAHSLDVARKLILYSPVEVMDCLAQSEFVPYLNPDVMTYQELARGIHLGDNHVKKCFVKYEQHNHQFPLTIAYLKLVDAVLEVSVHQSDWLVLAGLSHTIQLFTMYNTWMHEDDVVWILKYCFQILHQCLNVCPVLLSPAEINAPLDPQHPVSHMGHSARHMVFTKPLSNILSNVALYSILELGAGRELLHVNSLGEQALMDVIEDSPSWNEGKGVMFCNNIQLGLSILIRAIHYKSVHQKPCKLLLRTEKPSCLEDLLYMEHKVVEDGPPSQQCVLLMISTYMFLTFIRKIRILSLKLLKMVAANVKLSLNTVLGLEPQMLRNLFLEPLNSDCESIQLKVCILDFIRQCIHDQPSLAQAFINFDDLETCTFKEVDQDGDTTGVLVFANRVVSREGFVLTNPVYEAVIRLLHSLWLARRTKIITYIRSRQRFWRLIFSPLLSEPIIGVEVYAHLLNMLSTELYWITSSGGSYVELQKVIAEILLEKRNVILDWSRFCCIYIDRWTDEHEKSRIIDCNKAVELTCGKRSPEMIQVTVSWKELVFILCRYFSDMVTFRQKRLLIHHLMVGLAMELQPNLHNIPAIVSLAEAASIVAIRWPEGCAAESSSFTHHLAVVFDNLVPNFSEIPAEGRVFLYLATTNLARTEVFIYNEVKISNDDFLANILRLISFEMDACESLHKLPTSTDSELPTSTDNDDSLKNLARASRPLVLALCLGLKLNDVFCDHSYAWKKGLKVTDIVRKLTGAIITSLQEGFNICSCLLLDILQVLAQKDGFAIETAILETDIWQYLMPPSEVMEIHNLDLTKALYVAHEVYEKFSFNKWNPIYRKGLDLACTLMETGNLEIKLSCLNFFEYHKENILNVLTLSIFSSEPEQLDLAISAIRLIYEVFRNREIHSCRILPLLLQLLDSLAYLLDISCMLLGEPDLLLYRMPKSRPTIIDSAFILEPVDNAIVEEIRTIQTKLLSMVSLILSLFTELCIPFTELINAIQLNRESLNVEFNFGSRDVAFFGRGLPVIDNFKHVGEFVALLQEVIAEKPVMLHSSPPMMPGSQEFPKLADLDRHKLNMVLEKAIHFLVTNSCILSLTSGKRENKFHLFSSQSNAENIFYYTEQQIMENILWGVGGTFTTTHPKCHKPSALILYKKHF